MKFTCPNCFETLSLAALIEHDAARDAVRAALEFPAPLGKQLLQYAGLFKPAQRALSMDRFSTIINELLPMIKAAHIERNGRAWAAPQPYWSQAFDVMWMSRDKLTLPLKSHGYLLEIIAGITNKAEGSAERKSEQGRKYGAMPNGTLTTNISEFTPCVNSQTDHVGDVNNMVDKAAKKAKAIMPDHISDQLKVWKAKGKRNGH